jgi:4'-phosphopantetheinyl transferase
MPSLAWTPPAAGAIHLWRICLRRAAEAHARAPPDARLLCPLELARAAQINCPLTRKRFKAGRAALREILAKYEAGSMPASLRIASTREGKPYLLESRADIRFSVAHSGDAYFAAVARGLDVGVDIEPLGRNLANVRRLAARWLHPEEAQWVGDDASRFLLVWTRKEAYVKAVGTGVAQGRVKEFMFDDRGGLVLAGKAGSGGWRVQNFEVQIESEVGSETFTGSVVAQREASSAQLIDAWFTY